MKSKQEIKEELSKCAGDTELSADFFKGWIRALEWVLE